MYSYCYMYTYMYSEMLMCLFIYIYIYIHTYIHIYIYKEREMCMYAWRSWLPHDLALSAMAMPRAISGRPREYDIII